MCREVIVNRAAHRDHPFLRLTAISVSTTCDSIPPGRTAFRHAGEAPPDTDPAAESKKIAAAPLMSEHLVSGAATHAGSVPDLEEEGRVRDSDDEPMVYVTPRDYATSARQERDRRIAAGAAPDTVILWSEVRRHVARRAGESAAVNAMVARGVAILNDQSTADVVPSTLRAADGRAWDLGPGSGATKGEFRAFQRWFSATAGAGERPEGPAQWSKFEKPSPRASGCVRPTASVDLEIGHRTRT